MQFFKTASQKPWFSRTLFIITGDHTLFNSRDNFYSTFHIPLLLYTPSGKIIPSRKSTVASHIDILLTVLDILKIPAVHSSMGKSVFSESEHYCFEKYGNDYCIISNDYVLLNNLNTEPRLYNYKTDPSLKKDLADSFKNTVSDLNKKLLAYIQTTTNVMSGNTVYRDNKRNQ